MKTYYMKENTTIAEAMEAAHKIGTGPEVVRTSASCDCGQSAAFTVFHGDGKASKLVLCDTCHSAAPNIERL